LLDVVNVFVAALCGQSEHPFGALQPRFAPLDEMADKPSLLEVSHGSCLDSNHYTKDQEYLVLVLVLVLVGGYAQHKAMPGHWSELISY